MKKRPIKNLKTIRVFTFGQPRVGSDHYSATYDQLLNSKEITGDLKVKYFRFVNNHDPVPRCPINCPIFKLNYDDSPSRNYEISGSVIIPFLVAQQVTYEEKYKTTTSLLDFSVFDHFYTSYIDKVSVMIRYPTTPQ